MRLPALALSLSLLPVLALGQEAEDYPKLGPDARPVTDATDYLRTSAAPDYWAFSFFTKPQFTTSACSIAAVTAALNGLNGLPEMASETVMTQEDLLELAGAPLWAELSAEGGDGVTFAQLAEFAAAGAAAALPGGATVESWQPTGPGDLDRLRADLAANEVGAEDAMLVYFNQGVVTGDWDGPHVAVIGAYDAAADSVLILEVDQEWYIPYWTPAPVLLDAMLKPTSAEHGPLEGETGGLVRIALPPAT